MTRDEIIYAVRDLAVAAAAGGENACASLLFAVAASMKAELDNEMLDHVGPFTRRALRECQAKIAAEKLARN